MGAGPDQPSSRADWRPRALVIADSATAGAAASEAIAASDGRLLAAIGWADTIARFERQGLSDIVLAETEDVPDAVLDAVLPRLVAWAQAHGTRIVVSFMVEQIDLVTACLPGPGVALLCQPNMAERVGSVMLASAMPASEYVHDVGHEAESVRLRRLNEEVARIAETLARLTRSEADVARPAPRADAVGERSLRYDVAPAVAPAIDIAPREIRDAIRARRMRDQMFGGGLFEDPAWDMLLDLFAAELERTQVSVSSLCIAAAVAPTTALRWIARMSEAGLFERHPDPFDRRRAFMALSERASTGMRLYVAALRRAGLGIA